jgi:hypothetical protein
MNLDIFRTLVVDESLVLCGSTSILPPRGSATREGDLETNKG